MLITMNISVVYAQCYSIKINLICIVQFYEHKYQVLEQYNLQYIYLTLIK